MDYVRNLSVIAHVDSGKCFMYGTKIRLANGKYKLVENMTFDDYVLGLDGKPKKVVEIHHGTEQLYRIKQKYFNDYIVNGKHELVLKFANLKGPNGMQQKIIGK